MSEQGNDNDKDNDQRNSDAARPHDQPALPAELLAPLVEAKLRIHNLPAADRVWQRLLTADERAELGGDVIRAYKDFGGTLGIWARLHPGSWEPRAVIDIARATGLMDEATHAWLARELAPYDPTPAEGYEERIARARRARRLVLVQGNGHYLAYWDGAAVDQPWADNLKVWELLWKLAENARARRDVAWDEVSRARRTRAIVDRRLRLGRMLPADLDALIDPGASANSYRLGLEPDEVELFQLDDWIVEPQ